MHPLFLQPTAQSTPGLTPRPDGALVAAKEGSTSFQNVFDTNPDLLRDPPSTEEPMVEETDVADADTADISGEKPTKQVETAPQIVASRKTQVPDNPPAEQAVAEVRKTDAPPVNPKADGTVPIPTGVSQDIESTLAFHTAGMAAMTRSLAGTTAIARPVQSAGLPASTPVAPSVSTTQPSAAPVLTQASHPAEGASDSKQIAHPLVPPKTPAAVFERPAVAAPAQIPQNPLAQSIPVADSKTVKAPQPILAADAAVIHQMPAQMASVDPKTRLTPLPAALPATPEEKVPTQSKDSHRQDRLAPPQPILTAQTAMTQAAPPAALAAAPVAQWTAPVQFDAARSEAAEQRLADVGLAPVRSEAPSAGTFSQTTTPRADLPPQTMRQLAEVMAQAPGKPVEIALSPAELGRVRMMVSVTDTGVVVSLMAERPETLDLMRRNIDQLGNDFAELGYDDIAFSFGSSDADGQTAQDEKARGDVVSTSSKTADDDAADTIPQITLRSGAETGLDLRL